MRTAIQMLGIDQLSVEDRLVLVEEIWDSIAVKPDDVPISDAQKSDLQARLAAFKDNPQAGTSWEDVKARLRSKP